MEAPDQSSTYIAAFLFLLVMGFLFQLILLDYASDPKEENPSITFFPALFPSRFLYGAPPHYEECRRGKSDRNDRDAHDDPGHRNGSDSLEILAGYLYYSLLWMFTGSFHILFYSFVQEDSLFDPYPIIGGYAYVAISGGLFLSLGIFASALTRSQLIAGIVSFSLVFGFIVVGSFSRRNGPALD